MFHLVHTITQMSLRAFDMSYCKDTPLLPNYQQGPYLIPARHTTLKHAQKTRKIRFNQSRASPVRSASTPTTQCRGTALEEAYGNFTGIGHRFSIDPTCLLSYTHMLPDSWQTTSQPQQSSPVSTWSNSGNALWPASISRSSTDCSGADTADLTPPNLTFSDTDSSFANLKYATGYSISSSNSDAQGSSADQLLSRAKAPNTYGGHRPKLMIDTTPNGTPSDFYDSPIEWDRSDQFPDSGSEGQDIGQRPSISHHCVAGLEQPYPGCFNGIEALVAPGAGPLYHIGDSLSNQASVPWCHCHVLLKRPDFASTEPREIINACTMYFRQMRKCPQTVLRRLQDRFEVELQRVRDAVTVYEEYAADTLSLIRDINPTIQEGLSTLKLLNFAQPPTSLQGYISLAFFAKAWLSLEEQPGISVVNTALFVETAHYIARNTPLTDRAAYDILLQLLWNPSTATTSPPASQALFCPTIALLTLGSSPGNPGPKTTPRTCTRWVLNHVCREIVEGKSERASSKKKRLLTRRQTLYSKAPASGLSAPSNLCRR